MEHGTQAGGGPDEVIAGLQATERHELPSSELALMILNLTLSNVSFTDIILHEGRPLRIYTPDGLKTAENIIDPVTGAKVMEEAYIPSATDMESLLHTIDPTGWKERIQHRAVDEGRSFSGSDRLRLNFYYERNDRLAGVIRRFPVEIPSLEKLQAPDILVNMLAQRRGLILVVGQTAAGKSTTCAALLAKLSKTWATHIVTVENPIEFVHSDGLAAFSQREVGRHGLKSTALGVEDAMRQAPGVIYVSEIRDKDTAEAVFYAQESGHLVIATTHGRNVIEGLQRLSRFFPQDRQARLHALAANLVGAIGQVLVPVVKRRNAAGQLEGDGKTRIGYRAFYEVLNASKHGNKLAQHISDDQFERISEQLDALARGTATDLKDVHLMNEDLAAAVKSGEVLRSDAIAKSFNSQDLIRRLGAS
jgi:Tfp pilus assembly pilus retraction ATPase PilT